MASNFLEQADDSSFSFAVGELQPAKAEPKLTVDPGPKKPSYKELGSDPYNSSGGLDRTQNWTRIRKR
jgi:hypothetical protein